MRTQNVIAACVFSGMIACYAAMQLLSLYPANTFLWAFNITFAREIRPVFELFDVLAEENSRLVLAAFIAMTGLCWLAWHQRSTIITSLTTHSALFFVLYANMASHGATVQAELSASAGLAPAFQLISNTLPPIDLAMMAIAAALLVTCLTNHFSIMREIALQLAQCRLKARTNMN